jgi:hypothetical protein
MVMLTKRILAWNPDKFVVGCAVRTLHSVLWVFDRAIGKFGTKQLEGEAATRGLVWLDQS